jgi:hypothetical protein
MNPASSQVAIVTGASRGIGPPLPGVSPGKGRRSRFGITVLYLRAEQPDKRGCSFMLYELTTLSCPLLLVGDAAKRAVAWMGESSTSGEFLGCWRTEFGTLGRVLLLRCFETAEGMAAERERALLSQEPFDGGDIVTAFETASYTPFPFLPAVRPGHRGAVYEFRTYRLKPGGLSPTLAGWRDAIVDAHEYAEHLVTNMYALDGAPRITHLWAFESLEERGRLRASAYDAGVWPPKFGPGQILEATSMIGLPEAFSPLH